MDQLGISRSNMYGFIPFVLGFVVIICNLAGFWNESSVVGMWFCRNQTVSYAVSTFMVAVGGFFCFKNDQTK